jgi:ParB family chromosome partitioning protein
MDIKNEVAIIKIDEIIRRKPFDGLFQLEIETVSRIEKSIKENGYDEKFPVIVWKGENVCIDGHQRLYALHLLNKKTVPVVYAEFKDEKEAVEYAIRIQRDRRNITDAEIVKRVLLLDERKEVGANRYSNVGGSSEPPTKQPEPSAETTAKKAGTSATKVKKIRTIKDHAPSEIMEAVESGQMSINEGYRETQKTRKTEVGHEKRESGDIIKFEKSFNAFLEQLIRARNNGWVSIDREYAAECTKRLSNIVGG